jgi:16S rRNA (cytosine967-C5)-methyltransferase
VFQTQDEASQLVAQLVVDLEPGSVLDLCASPGGKTTYIRGGRPASTLVACDLRPRRVELLRSVLDQAGATDIPIVRADALQPPPFSRVFDVVLLDAPCSGLGTLRREPEIRWRRAEGDLSALSTAQQRMIRQAALAVAPGGYLVYATCSSEPEENESVVDEFLAARLDFHRLPPAAHPWRDSVLNEVVDDRGDFRTLPPRHGLEAFYAAVLRRGGQA